MPTNRSNMVQTTQNQLDSLCYKRDSAKTSEEYWVDRNAGTERYIADKVKTFAADVYSYYETSR